MSPKTIGIIVLACLLAGCATDAPATATATATLAPSAEPTASPTASPVPTQAAPVPATVNVGQAFCRVGPGGVYLLRALLREGDEVEILGAMELNANWVLVRPTNQAACWINTDLVQASQDGPFNPISDPHAVLPMSSYYSPLRNVTATRTGNVVRVRWDPLVLREDDVTTETPYVLEAWVCQNGEYVFRAFGTEEYGIRVVDESGCEAQSRGQVAGAEIHGYTNWVTVPWP